MLILRQFPQKAHTPLEKYPAIKYNFQKCAGVAQLLERFLAKEEVQG